MNPLRAKLEEEGTLVLDLKSCEWLYGVIEKLNDELRSLAGASDVSLETYHTLGLSDEQRHELENELTLFIWRHGLPSQVLELLGAIYRVFKSDEVSLSSRPRLIITPPDMAFVDEPIMQSAVVAMPLVNLVGANSLWYEAPIGLRIGQALAMRGKSIVSLLTNQGMISRWIVELPLAMTGDCALMSLSKGHLDMNEDILG